MRQVMNARFVSAVIALIGSVAMQPLTNARADDAGSWMTDPISDCSVWSVDTPDKGDGISWWGACIDGKAGGFGVLTFWDKDGLEGRYTGEMSGGKLNGEGRLYLRDESDATAFNQFIGRFADSKPDGPGFLMMASGARFYGELIDGIRHGKGVVVTKEGWLVKGEFVDGKGVGTLVVDYTTEEGEHYIGQAEDGKRQGFGILTTKDQNFYAGEFAKGLPAGLGLYRGHAGDRYLGQYDDGKPHGFGTSMDAEGNVVQGRFVEGEMNGTILVTQTDGEQSVTTWKEVEGK